ncbi:MAG: type II toxin-antitoxin system VapC family toxin [Acidimicrobiia bacterium]
MLVVDASCLYEVVADGEASESVRQILAADADQAAPHLIDAEVLSLIRRDRFRNLLDSTGASQAVEDLRSWPGERFSHLPLLERAWELRDAVRTWDALYVALAEAMGATLLTRDSRLAKARGPSCPIQLP